MPGPLREACGFCYQEFSTLREPIPLKGDPFDAGAENKASVWADMILPETAKPLAFYDHPFFGKYPAITRNDYGKGTVTYEGTILSDALQEKVLRVRPRAGPGVAARRRGCRRRSRALREAVSRDGRTIRFYLNFSAAPQTFAYGHGASTDLLTGKPVAAGQTPHARPVGPGGDPGVAAPRAVRAQSPPPLPLNWSASSAKSTLKLVRLP